MAEDYPKEKLKELYELLPEDLKEAMFSDKTANDIYDVCLENGIEDKNPEMAKYTGYVMLGLLSPNEFEKPLKEKLGLESDLAKKVSQGITRLVFLPVKNSLEMIHKIKIEIPPEPAEEPAEEEEGETLEEEIPAEETPVEETQKKEMPKKRLGQDIYHEPIE